MPTRSVLTTRAAYTVCMYKEGSHSVVDDTRGKKLAYTLIGAVALQAALDAIKTVKGGTLYGDGYHKIESEVKLGSKDGYIIQGSGRPSNEWSPATSGGFVLEFSGVSGRFTDGGDSKNYNITFRDMGMIFSGVQTDQKLDLEFSIVTVEHVMWVLDCDGNTTVITIGTSGPSACTFTLRDIILVDNRNGGSYRNWLSIHVESGIIEGFTWIANIGAGAVQPRGIYFYAVSWIVIRNFTIYTSSGFDTDLRKYDYQFTCGSGGTFRIICENVQFFDPADILASVIVAPAGGTFILEGKNPTEFEGSAVIVKPTTGGDGTVKLQFKGRGYENQIKMTGNGGEQTIPHGLVDTPTHVRLTPYSANPVQSSAKDTTNVYVTADNGEEYIVDVSYWEE